MAMSSELSSFSTLGNKHSVGVEDSDSDDMYAFIIVTCSVPHRLEKGEEV